MSGDRPPPSPLTGALTIGLSVFVGLTSMFLAVMAFAIAPHQLDSVGLATEPRNASSTAQALCYVAGAAALLNGIVSLGRGRKRPAVTAACTIVFVALVVCVAFLYVNAW